MKKLLSLVLSILLVIAVVPINALAAKQDVHLFMDIPFGIKEEKFREKWQEAMERDEKLPPLQSESEKVDYPKAKKRLMTTDFFPFLQYPFELSVFFDKNGKSYEHGLECYEVFLPDEDGTENQADWMETCYDHSIKIYENLVKLYGEPLSYFAADYNAPKYIIPMKDGVFDKKKILPLITDETNGEIGLTIFSYFDNIHYINNFLFYDDMIVSRVVVSYFPRVQKINENKFVHYGQVELSSGEYIVGEHIPAGEYRVTVPKGYTTLFQYRGRSMENLYFLDAKDDDEVGRMVLKDGDRLEINGKTLFIPFGF